MDRAVLVTGAAGFIGSNLVRHLLTQGERVVGLDNFDDYYEPAWKRRNVAELATLPGSFQLVEGDIRDTALLERLFSEHEPKSIAHLAGLAGVRRSVEEAERYCEVNITGSLRLLEVARRNKMPNFVFASTSSAYGRTTRVPFVEDDTADRPLAPYPASKRAVELLGHAQHHSHGQNFTALRFFTVYGPGGRPDMMAHLVLDSMRTGRPIPLYAGGKLFRDWTFVDDIVQGIARALERPLGYEVINLGRGEPVDVLEFIGELERLSGKRPNLVDTPMNDADVPGTIASIEKARDLLGYRPQISVPEGARRYYEWFVQNVGPIHPL
jgi:UDP-glucuronate 4-epimerase